ncbi:phosphate ABC transporter permease PstA [Anaerorhabdus furcosa]|uniref:Phosphate transport system permease protein PstA n=1 Tax=Anaerorhabdus furcosa TaxID=118967 RepID=A0A1T4NW10_9FIRM|nr:phosphate ABC transporter permease PstA [Anaerorhabdus furcosa]SJZ83411.1 phosphate transport system permease protein [Anaerorhabdus furcosa]
MSTKIKDKILNTITYFASGISVFVLGAVLVFLFSKGFSTLNWDLIVNNYWSQNLLGTVDSVGGDYTISEEVDGIYSARWGIALKDNVNSQKEKVIEVTYIHPESPLKTMLSSSAGDNNKEITLEDGYTIQKIDIVTSDGIPTFTGKIMSQDAATVISNIDSAQKITSIYYKTTGGGIRSSLITTLYLIVISLVIALPIGVCSAIYLHEYASKSKLNKLIRQGIETLTGVPSIVYGLMGVTVLFPVTQLFGATTTSILLGGLTMSIILLPTIMKSTEEALIVVPQSLRDGSLSLGATKSQTIFKVVLPCAVNGILTGVLLSIGRVIGESAALIYTMGTFINDSPKLLSQGTTLSLMIWSFMSGEQPNFELASAISIIILVIVLVLNFIVKAIAKKFTKNFA